MKLDLGCGKGIQEGFTGVDFIPLKQMWPDGPPPGYYDDYEQVDLFDPPWPWETSSVDEVYTSHLVEHIPHYLPQFNGVDGWWVFFEELHRIMKPDGLVTIRHPFSRSDRAFWDPTHTRYIHYQTWFYLEKDFRAQSGTDHYTPDSINFKIDTIDAIGNPVLLQGRNESFIDFANQHYFNPTEDLLITMRAVK